MNIRKRLLNSYNSTKCHGAGNGRKISQITARLHRQLNKKDRQYLKKELFYELLETIS